MEKMYITITGLHHYYGVDLFERDMVLTLVKDKKNEYDKEAIEVRLEGLGKVGYVANSTSTVLGESSSAGRIYDKFEEKANAKVMYKLKSNDSLFCEFIC